MRPVGHQRLGAWSSAAGDAVVLQLPDTAAVSARHGTALAEAECPVRYEPELAAPVIAVLRIAVPYTGIILSTRESAQMRNECMRLGVSQVSAGSSVSG